MAINLGTRGVAEAMEMLEYCNLDMSNLCRGRVIALANGSIRGIRCVVASALTSW